MGAVNGDGVDDLIVGAWRADLNGRSDAGESYVVFGRGGAACCGPADTTTTGTSSGTPDGVVDVSDYSYYLTP